MFKKALLTLTVLFVASGAWAECEDDARLEDIHGVLTQIEAGTLEKPLMLTAETWINIYPDVLKKLGDNIAICPGIGLIDGQPFAKVELDFDLLFEMFLSAVTDKDRDRLEYIENTFTAKKIDAVEAIQLEERFLAKHPDVAKYIYDHFKLPDLEIDTKKTGEGFDLMMEGIRSMQAEGYKQSEFGNKARIYEAMGGYTKDNRSIYVEVRTNRPHIKERDIFLNWEKTGIVPVVHKLNNSTVEVLKRIGFNVLSGEHDFLLFKNKAKGGSW